VGTGSAADADCELGGCSEVGIELVLGTERLPGKDKVVSVVIKGGAGRKDGWMGEGRPDAAMFVRVDLIEPMMDIASDAVSSDTRTVEFRFEGVVLGPSSVGDAAAVVELDVDIDAVGLSIDIPKVPNTLFAALRRGGGCLVMTVELF